MRATGAFAADRSTGIHQWIRHVLRTKRILVLWLALAVMGVHEVRGASSNPEADFREGYAATVSRNWDQAIALYTKAIELNPRHVEAYFQRALAREMANQIDEAKRDYEKTLELLPKHYLATEYLAKLYQAGGDSATAVDLYYRALALTTDPKWQSIIRWWISEARKKTQDAPDEVTATREHRSRGRGAERSRR